MKRHFQCMLSLVAFTCAMAHAAPPAAQMPPELGATYAKLGKAIATRNEAGVKEVWSPELVVNAPNNAILRRDEVIAALQSELLAYKDFRKVVEYVGVQDGIAVVMGYDTMIPVNGPGQGKQVMRRFTDVWSSKNAGWMLIARQATIAALSE